MRPRLVPGKGGMVGNLRGLQGSVVAMVVPAAMCRLRSGAAFVSLGAMHYRNRSHAAQRQGDERHEQDQGFELTDHFVRAVYAPFSER